MSLTTIRYLLILIMLPRFTEPDAVESTVQTCNPPVLIANGQITLSEEPPIEGTTMTYVCDHGFRTPGNGCSQRVCQVLNGMADWSGDQVKFRCVRGKCSFLTWNMSRVCNYRASTLSSARGMQLLSE